MFRVVSSSILDLYMEDHDGNMIDSTSNIARSQPPVRLCIACTRKDHEIAPCTRRHCRKIFPIYDTKGTCARVKASSNTEDSIRHDLIQSKASDCRISRSRLISTRSEKVCVQAYRSVSISKCWADSRCSHLRAPPNREWIATVGNQLMIVWSVTDTAI